MTGTWRGMSQYFVILPFILIDYKLSPKKLIINFDYIYLFRRHVKYFVEMVCKSN